MRSTRNAMVAVLLLSSATTVCSAQIALPAPVFVFFQRTPAHASRSSSNVFNEVRDDLLSWLGAHQVEVVGDAFAGKTWSQDEVPLITVQRIAQDNHATSLLHVSVDRPVMSWVKITLRCYDASGRLLWQSEVSNASAVTSGIALRASLRKLHTVLERHLGQPGLPVFKEQVP